VCSIQLNQHVGPEGRYARGKPSGSLCTVCAHRFEEGGAVVRWIGETLLGNGSPVEIREVGFLRREPTKGTDKLGDDVGRIDLVLVDPTAAPVRWCAVETQALCFSRAEMKVDNELAQNDYGQCAQFPGKMT
jgi:hypothetical protein